MARKNANPGAGDAGARQVDSKDWSATHSESANAAQALPFHPLADIFPLIEGVEFDDLVADIREHGLHEPIVVYEDMILDGRNRYRACEAAGVEPTFTVYGGDDPIAYVVSLNLRRRHLDESQRAMVAAKLATLRRGDNQHAQICAPSQEKAAELLNVSRRTVQHAREVQDHGAPELVRAVEQGTVSVSAAADLSTLPLDQQREIVARAEPRIVKQVAQKIRAGEMEARHAKRIARLAEIGDAPLPQDRKYPILYVDPPWKYTLFRADADGRSAESHYPCMETAELCKHPIPATDDAVLFLWTTAPHLPEALRVLEAWGFEYITNVVWVKDKTGLGFWVHNAHELLLIARRGDVPAPLPANRPPSVIHAPRREHSRKPDEAYELIERMYPELPKIELFARNARPGWAAWGNEAPRMREAAK